MDCIDIDCYLYISSLVRPATAHLPDMYDIEVHIAIYFFKLNAIGLVPWK